MLSVQKEGHHPLEWHCAFYAGKNIVEGAAVRLSFSGVSLKINQAAQQMLNEGEVGECYIDGQAAKSCGFDCHVVAAGEENLVLRFNPLNDMQIQFIRNLNAA